MIHQTQVIRVVYMSPLDSYILDNHPYFYGVITLIGILIGIVVLLILINHLVISINKRL